MHVICSLKLSTVGQPKTLRNRQLAHVLSADFMHFVVYPIACLHHTGLDTGLPKLLHCTVHYTEIHVNYNRTIQRGITLLHHKAVFTNPCYYATLATMALSLGPKGWHSIEV